VLNLTSVDWLIVLFYFAVVLGTGITLKSSIKSTRDFLQACRALPGWICGLTFIGVSLGAPEVIGLGGWGARYGLHAAQFYLIGAIPAMLFVGLFMMPFYYGSKARSVPEFLRLRFDEKTRALNAVLFAVMTVFSSGISLYVLARLIQALHLFDRIFYALGWAQGAFVLTVALLALIVLAYVALSGLTGAMYNQVLQFFLLIAGLLPVVLLGLKNVGGWNALKAAFSTASRPDLQGMLHSSASPTGLNVIGVGVGLGLVLGAGYWCADFRVLQTAMAAKNLGSARRAPLIAAVPALLLPFLVIVPGLLAVTLPTPHTTEVVRNEGGVIYHETTIVPKAAEEGRGLVPAKSDPVTGNLLPDAFGHPQLDYDMATPNLMLHYLPNGLLGLGLAALLASFMSGLAGNITAFNTVFTCDLYQAHIRKDATDEHYLAVGRWASVGAVLLSVAAAFAVLRFNSIMDVLFLVFAVVNAPLFATLLLGMFWKRATGHGAFVGLIAGPVAALLHHGLTLPANARPGVQGGWIAAVHHYPSIMAQNLWTAIFAFSAALMVTVVASLCTTPLPMPEFHGPSLVRKPGMWWKRPEAMATAILIAAIALGIFFY